VKQLSNELMNEAEISDSKLLDYLMPAAGKSVNDLTKNWMPMHEQCMLSTNCWCYLHFKGSMDKGRNPNGIHTCMINSLSVTDCALDPTWGPKISKSSCPCFISRVPGEGCIFGDMRPLKILAVVVLARKLGVTHIIEEGRYGGLTAYIYSLLGFKVTSIEYVPLDDVTDSLKKLAPTMRLLDGDGHVLTPQVVSEADPSERIAVIFDGTKRHDAYDTSWLKVKDKVVFAAFDDTNVGEPFPYVYNYGPRSTEATRKAKRVLFGFDLYLAQHGEIFWNSNRTMDTIVQREGHGLTKLLKYLKHASHDAKAGFTGGLENLEKAHFTLVQGGKWEKPGCKAPGKSG